MSVFYSPAAKGFFRSDVHGSAVPDDAVEISETKHADLLRAQSHGKRIDSDQDGYPVAVDPPVPSVDAFAQRKREAIHKEAFTRQPAAVRIYPQHERDSWAQQVEEAKAYDTAGDKSSVSTPLLDALSTRRGVGLATMVSKVLNKQSEFAQAFGPVLGAQQALEGHLEEILAEYDAGNITADQARQQIAAIDETDDANWPAPN